LLAPDAVGFGYTERPAWIEHNLDIWTDQLIS
jgi:hypothetical protein